MAWRYRKLSSDLLGLQADMQRLLETALEADDLLPAVSRRGSWAPPVDIYETADDVRIVVDLPGMTSDALDVTLERGILSIRGERGVPAADPGAKYLRIERPSGTFSRKIRLPEGIQPDRVSASLKDGVLEVIVPKGAAARPKKIVVTTEGDQ